jgi:cellulose synthase/poly-beta-1,6-N-acetylglucosamine synthase-like glycosyltransferase
VAAANGDVVVFVDADVTVHPDALDRLAAAFDERPELVAVIGSYDDRPSQPGVVSRYRNLLHHHVHHTRGRTATHFWTGLGAVRRDVFAGVGGFDEATWARDLEDVWFGHRLVDAGHTIEVRPEVSGTHHKRFTLRSMVRTDVLDRAAPWTTLMWSEHLRTDRFVLSPTDAASAVAVLAGVGATAGAVVAPSRAARRAAVASAGVFVAVNARLWTSMARAGGAWLAVAAVPLHALHLASALAGLALGTARWVGGHLRTTRRRTG